MNRRIALALIATSILCVLAYWPGLYGPLLLDDEPNLRVLTSFLKGEASWAAVVFGNGSGPLGRPVAMLTFALDARWFGESVFALKATNLALHLFNGLLVFAFVARVLARDPTLRRHAGTVAAFVMAAWLLHPLQVSTVLYVVQRMAELSAGFVLIALLCFVHGREALERGNMRSARLWLFLGFPLASALAALSKENGVLAPLLCAVVELVYFVPATRRPVEARAFFALFLIAPFVAGVALLAQKPARLLDGYELRDFDLAQRLLSEPRALLDYVVALAWPRGHALGVFADDFAISRGLLDPPSTAVALLVWASLLAIAGVARKRLPAFAFGIAFFLAAHALESSVLALELYFEHRNYLPSIGIFVAIAALAECAIARAQPHAPNARRLVTCGFALVIVAIGSATLARARIWQRHDILVEETLKAHPRSLRARMEWATLLVERNQVDAAMRVLDELNASDSESERLLGAAYRIAVACHFGRDVDRAWLDALDRQTRDRPTMVDLHGLDLVAAEVRAGRCGPVDASAYADTLRRFADASRQPERIFVKWKLRALSADLYARAGRVDDADAQATLAWDSGAADPAVGFLLASMQIEKHRFDDATRTLELVRRRLGRFDVAGARMVEDLGARLESLRQAG